MTGTASGSPSRGRSHSPSFATLRRSNNLLRVLAWAEPPFGAAAKRIGLPRSSAQVALRSLDGGQHLRGRQLVDPLLADWLRSLNLDAARSHAAEFSPAELQEQLRATAASNRRTPFSKPVDPLIDVIVHGQDIARPLGRTHPMDADRVAAVINPAARSPHHGPRIRLDDLRLVADDVDCTVGTGPAEVHGPIGDLLLAVTGRPVALGHLSGPGVAALTGQLGTRSA